MNSDEISALEQHRVLHDTQAFLQPMRSEPWHGRSGRVVEGEWLCRRSRQPTGSQQRRPARSAAFRAEGEACDLPLPIRRPSQLELFDYKPQLEKFRGQDLPESVRRGQRLTGMTAHQSRFPDRAFDLQVRSAREIGRNC